MDQGWEAVTAWSSGTGTMIELPAELSDTPLVFLTGAGASIPALPVHCWGERVEVIRGGRMGRGQVTPRRGEGL